MHVARAGQLLVSGQPERVRHPEVPSLVHQLRLDRHRAGGKGRHLRPGPARRLGGNRPAPAQLPAELAQLEARLRAGFQLLPLQLELERLPGIPARVFLGVHCRRPRCAVPSRPLPEAARYRARQEAVPLLRPRCEPSLRSRARQNDAPDGHRLASGSPVGRVLVLVSCGFGLALMVPPSWVEPPLPGNRVTISYHRSNRTVPGRSPQDPGGFEGAATSPPPPLGCPESSFPVNGAAAAWCLWQLS